MCIYFPLFVEKLFIFLILIALEEVGFDGFGLLLLLTALEEVGFEGFGVFECRTGCSRGFAFVNFTCKSGAIRLRRALNGYKWWASGWNKTCQIAYARIQVMIIYQSSTIMFFLHACCLLFQLGFVWFSLKIFGR